MNKPAGVILTGGRSSRMEVDRKALVKLGDQSLLQRVIDRLAQQVEPLLLSCESDHEAFKPFGLTRVPDHKPRYRGPLVGLYSAMCFLRETGSANNLLLCPCDAPFVPTDLVNRLLAAQRLAGPAVVVASYLDELQPTFSLWHTSHFSVIRDAVMDHGMGGLKQVLKLLPFTTVDWERTQPPPFFNVNSPGDLKAAGIWLEQLD